MHCSAYQIMSLPSAVASAAVMTKIMITAAAAATNDNAIYVVSSFSVLRK